MIRKGHFFLTASAFALALGAAAPVAAADLKSEDCAKCHAQQPKDIDAAGGAHKTEISCQDCHTGHRPASKNNIPQCGMCHDGEDHYKLANCLGCHTNPHMPKNVTFDKKQTATCVSCHKDKQAGQLKQFPSKHTQLACSFCHDVHGKKPACTTCHKPHAPTMTAADCGTCHKAHQPLNVLYPATVKNDQCGSCHKKPATALAASATKHAGVACVACHKDKHRMVPGCLDCHGEGKSAVAMKHPGGILKKFPNCLTCHNHPHDLNNFAAAAPAKPAAAPAKQ